MNERAFVVSHGDAAVTAAVVASLERAGWAVETSASSGEQPLNAVVYVPGLIAGDVPDHVDAAGALVDLVNEVRPRVHGAARVVAVGSRDWLGWPTRPRVAAQSAGLIAAVRSLALAHGRDGVTVNAVIGLPPDAADEPATGTHLYEPIPLTGHPVTAADIAATVAFFVDPRSAYLTGQVLHCCGGASLLSSLSV